MKIFATVIKDYGLELIENLTLLISNINLSPDSSKWHEDQVFIETISTYKEDIEDHLLDIKTDMKPFAHTLKAMNLLLSKNLREDSDATKMVLVSVINKLIYETISISQKIQMAVTHLSSETESLKVIAKSWEFNCPLNDLVDKGRVIALIGGLCAAELDKTLVDEVRDLKNEDLDSIATKVDGLSGCGDFNKSYHDAGERYSSLYNKMEKFHQTIYEEFVEAAEKPNENSVHHYMNGIYGKVRVSELAIIKVEIMGISTDSKKLLNSFIALYDKIRDDLMNAGDFSSLGKLDSMIKEKQNHARHGIQTLDQLDVAMERCLRVLNANLDTFLKIKISKKELFNEMFLVLSKDGMKKAS